MITITLNPLIIKDNTNTLLNLTTSFKQSTGIIGQSGSGKSLLLKSLLNLTPHNLTSQSNITANIELTPHTTAFVPQNPFTSLSPMTRIRDQFFCSNTQMDEALDWVGLNPILRDRFPKELSGGQLQRIVIAMAWVKKPKILLLDEPTTALDHRSKKRVLSCLKKLKEELNTLLIFVTHDIYTIQGLCEEIRIIQGGKLIEEGQTNAVLSSPHSSYTQALIDASFDRPS